MAKKHRAGFVTLVGRPNAGKSTLLNAFLGEKIAIVTPKPQTTRDRILGIVPVKNGQLVFLDTPGVHRAKRALNKHMTDVALNSIGDVDVVLFVLDGADACTRGITNQDKRIIETIAEHKKPTIAVVNKVDKVEKDQLLPLIQSLVEHHPFESVIPVCAISQNGLDQVLAETQALVPESPPLYPENDLTDKPLRFLVAELLREKLIMSVKKEVPYSVAVEITNFKQRPDRDLVDIDATIHVERQSQKGIILGKGGKNLKKSVAAARQEMETLIGQQVFLRTHVRVEPNWTRNEKSMRKLGYEKT